MCYDPSVAKPSMENRSYYDEFSSWYENHRGRGYHQLLDDLEVDLVRRYCHGGRALEVGCGTGLILQRVAEFADNAVGIDLSAGMLAKAQDRGLQVAQASATDLPCPDDSFDVVFSFKVLAHVEQIHMAMHEMARVTRPGGYVLAEFYNPRSLRYMVKRLKTPTAVSTSTNDEAVYTRYDDPATIRSYLPASLQFRTFRGVRIVTPVAAVHRIPGVRRLVSMAEWKLADAPIARNLGGFLIVVAQKV